jgi:hypothetical protein
MKGLWRVGVLVCVIFATCFSIPESISQDTGGGGGGRRGMRDRGGPGRFDPAQMMSRMLENYQERLGFSDTEWEAVKPIAQTVMEKQFQSSMAPFGGMRGMRRGQRGDNNAASSSSTDRSTDTPPAPPEGGPPEGGPPGGPGGPPGGPGGPPPGFGPQMPEMEALQTVLEKADSPEADIQTKLKEYRAARQKQQDELKAAREKLRVLMTPRQEAMSVMMGLLD